MLARNCDFITLAASAASRARVRSFRAARSAMSLVWSSDSSPLNRVVSQPNSSVEVGSMKTEKSLVSRTFSMPPASRLRGVSTRPDSQ